MADNIAPTRILKQAAATNPIKHPHSGDLSSRIAPILCCSW